MTESALDRMLADVRAKGGEPKMLLAHPTDVEKLGGETFVRSWCSAHGIRPRFSKNTTPGTAYMVTPPDSSWK